MESKRPTSRRWIFFALPAVVLVAIGFGLFRTRAPLTAQRPEQYRLPDAASPLNSGPPLQPLSQSAPVMFYWEVNGNKVGSVGAETALVFLPDNKVATASEDFQVRLWDARDGKLLRQAAEDCGT